MLEINQIIEGKVESIAFGGDGILRFDGFVVFIPFTAVGDVVLCSIQEVKRSFAKGSLIEIKEASQNRIVPPCPYFGICGGCQLQHLHMQAQLDYKLKAVLDSLIRIGHLTIPPIQIIPASKNWSYRRHITLQLKATKTGFETGYIGRDHRTFVVIQTCPIFNVSGDLILTHIQELVKRLQPSHARSGRLTLLKNPTDQFILFFQFDHDWKIPHSALQWALEKFPSFGGMMVQTSKEFFSIGNCQCEETVDKITVRFSPQTFIQNHPEQSKKIYQQICQISGQSNPGHILDLYCGFGMTSLLLAKRNHSVTGVEQNPKAIEFARENARLNHLENVKFITGDVEKVLPEWLNTHRTQLIIVNPPRQGLTNSIIQTLLIAKVHTLIYVSCMPSTLARDLSRLCLIYEIDEGTVYDMFPQTGHVETVIHLKIKSEL